MMASAVLSLCGYKTFVGTEVDGHSGMDASESNASPPAQFDHISFNSPSQWSKTLHFVYIPPSE
jgi:hypothetical protein